MTIKLVIITIIFLTLSGCLEHAPIKTGFEGKALPSFTFLLADTASSINTDSLNFEKPFVIFYFSPDCPYCRAQIRDIVKHNKELQNNKFLLITNYEKEQVQKVVKEFKIKDCKNIKVAIDSKSSFINYYYIPNVPYLAIYDKEKKFRNALIGRTDFKTIEQSLNAN